MKFIFLLLLLLVMTLQQPVERPVETLPLPKKILLPATVGYRFWRGIPVVQAGVGLQPSVEFGIDTTLNACLVTPDASLRWKLPVAAGQKPLRILERMRTVATTQIPSLRFNTFTLTQVPVGQLDLFSLLSPSNRLHPDAPSGWLGTPFLAAFQPTFYFDKQSIFLESRDASLPKDKDVVIVPMELRDGQPIVLVSLPGAKPFRALISTSAPITMIPTKAAQQAKLKALEWLSVRMPDGKIGKAARVIALKMGVKQATVKESNAIYLEHEGDHEAAEPTGILGLDFLRHFRVTLSYSRRMAAFVPIAPPRSPRFGTPGVPSDNHRARDGGNSLPRSPRPGSTP